MQVEVKVPQLSESVSEATLVAWHKKAGEAVKRDENLIDVETDKVVLELPAPVDGVLAKIIKKDGESVTSGEVIAVIDTDAKATVAPRSSRRRPRRRRAQPEAQAAAPARCRARTAPRVALAATKIAAEKGIDHVDASQGTGRDGRVTKGDVSCRRRHSGSRARSRSRLAPRLRPCPPAARAEQRVPMSRLRQRIAERLRAVAIDRRHPHHVQRGEHGAGDGAAQRATRTSSRRSTA